MNERNDAPYQTDNIWLASCLYALAVEFLGAVGPGDHLTFQFSPDSRITEIKDNFKGGTLRIEAMSLLRAYRTLKGLVARRREEGDG